MEMGKMKFDWLLQLIIDREFLQLLTDSIQCKVFLRLLRTKQTKTDQSKKRS